MASIATQETYWRDLERFVLPALGSRRLAQRPVDLARDVGMRWSELVGWRRSQVGDVRHKVRVTEQLVQQSDRYRVCREPKTSAGTRSITISTTTAVILAGHLDRYTQDGRDALVFTTSTGTPLTHSSCRTHHFRKALKKAGVRCGVHDLRHTSVPLAIASGADQGHPGAWATARSGSGSTATATRSSARRSVATAFDEQWQLHRSCAGIPWCSGAQMQIRSNCSIAACYRRSVTPWTSCTRSRR